MTVQKKLPLLIITTSVIPLLLIASISFILISSSSKNIYEAYLSNLTTAVGLQLSDYYDAQSRTPHMQAPENANHYLNIDFVNASIHNYKIGNTGYLYVIDHKGEIIYHYDEKQVGRIYQPDSSIKELTDLIHRIENKTLKTETGFLEYEKNQEKILANYQKINDLGWVVVAAIPEKEIYEQAYKINKIIIFVTIITSIVSAAGGLVVAGNIQMNTKKLKKIADTDDLTGLPNRKAIYELMEERFCPGKMQAMLLMDLNGFKRVNDTLGHDFGDLVLKETARVLKTYESNTVHLSRLGGDEFLIFVSTFIKEEQVITLAENIFEQIKEVKELNQNSIDISTGIGIAFSAREESYGELMKKADIAMYQSKKRKDHAKYHIYARPK